MTDPDVERLSRVYGPVTWDVYEQLDASLEPRGPDELMDLAGRWLSPGRTVLDAGCRDGAHLVQLVQRFDVHGVGIEPVARHVERGRDSVRTAALESRITLLRGSMHDIPLPDGSIDFVWCRDVLEQVEDLRRGLVELVRVMTRDARLLAFTTVSTDRLTSDDRELLGQHLGNVSVNLDRFALERAFEQSGLVTEAVHVIGTEWIEYAEERTRPASRALLRLARLRRQRAGIIASHGEDIHDHVEANLHWEIFQFLGKLEPRIYVLRRVR
jgi:cyclopropane fatty-acyl-phospholipid synthase-like methyltransferase